MENAVDFARLTRRLQEDRVAVALDMFITSRAKFDNIEQLNDLVRSDELELLKNFRLETTLHSGFEQDSQAFTVGRQKDLTPLRRERESIDAASLLATPEPWSKRARRS